MDLRQLEYFVELCHVRNYTRASENLHVAQPSVTKAIRQLEDELGVQLIDRSQRPLGLTESGQLFHSRARKILEELQDAVAEVKNATKCRRVVEFGVSPISGTALLHLLESTDVTAHNILYNVIRRSSAEVCERLESRELDIGWVLGTNVPPSLEFLPLEIQEAMLVLPEDNPLQDKAQITFEDLREQPFSMVFSQNKSFLVSMVMERCRKAGFMPKSSISVYQYHPSRRFAIECVRAGYGVSLLPDAAAAGIQDLPVRHMDPPLTFPVGLAYRKGEPLEPDVKRMIRFLQEYYPKYVGKAPISPKIAP